MSSYFTLELDTTGPTIQINAPTYSSRESNNTITVVGNEKLSNYQDIYIVDSSGNTHNVTFSFDGNETFSGNVIFSNYPIGVATIFAQLQDEVGNPSNVAQAHISIITSSYYSLFKLTLLDESRSMKIPIQTRTEDISSNNLNSVSFSEKSSNKDLNVTVRTSTTNITTNYETLSTQKRQANISEQKRLAIISDTN